MADDVSRRIRLKSQRLAAELRLSRRSQNAWALRLGLSKGYLSQLVNGRRSYPSPAVRRRLLLALELEFDELFEWESEGVATVGEAAERPRPMTTRMPAATNGPGKPRTRKILGDGPMQVLAQDLRIGARLLIRKPAFTALAAVVLALGIGANTAIFSVIKGVLLEPLNFESPESLVLLDENHLARGLNRFGVSPANLADWRDSAESFSHIAG